MSDEEEFVIYEYDMSANRGTRYGGGEIILGKQVRSGGGHGSDGCPDTAVCYRMPFSSLPYGELRGDHFSEQSRRWWRDLQYLYLMVERVQHRYAIQSDSSPFLKLVRPWLCRSAKNHQQQPKCDRDIDQGCAVVLATFNLLTDSGPGVTQRRLQPDCRIRCLESRDGGASTTMVEKAHDVTTRPFLRPPFIDSKVKLAHEHPDAMKEVLRCRVVPGAGNTTKKMGAGTNNPDVRSCPLLRQKQASIWVPLKIRNIFSVFSSTWPTTDASRRAWLDSVSLDAYMHILVRHWPQRDSLYIISAENDPDWDDLIKTTACYKYLLMFLFYKSHWTITWVSHPCSSVWYYNSQLIDYATAVKQLEPFAKAFPTYSISIGKCKSQNNNTCCGIFSSNAAYCLLYAPSQIERIVPEETDQWRAHMCDQLILSYLL